MCSFSVAWLEGLRYAGKQGQWSWVAHRVSGLLTVAFVTTHVLDSTLITFFPKLYKKTIQLFKHPLAAVIEIPLVGAVLYHAVNGLRIAVMDFRPAWWRHQRRSSQVVQVVFALLYVPMALKMGSGVLAGLRGKRS
jgi:succinate dehydrogenase / fumarate reductase cytochrome b subunit